MNSLTQILLWCPIQVTLLAIAALAVGGLAGRRRPAAGAVVAAAALLAVVGVTAMALSPWPDWAISWERLPWHNATAAVEVPANPSALGPAIQPTEPVFDDRHNYELPIASRATAAQERTESFAHRVWALVAGNGITIAAVLYLVGVSLMLLRIGLGLRAVAGYRRNSHPITDRSLNELADVVCAQLGYTRGIELRETTRLATPATIGWLRPMLLLPADWRRWTADERHAVLAHEIEHVRRNDFAAWMAAQFGVALHFYHPLVHWLANRLRLQQELAADAAAAWVVGGQRKYVTTLAAMALRQADEPLAWPARAFLPNSKTFLRRIDMLHRSKSLRGDVSRPAVFLSVAAVLLAAVCAAGIRGSVAAQQTAFSGSVDENGGATGNVALLALNQLNQAEQPRPVEQSKPPEAQRRRRRDLMKLKQIALAMHTYHAKHGHFPPAVVMGPDGKTPHSWRVELLPFLDNQALFDSYQMNEPWDSETNKKVLAAGADFFRSPFDDPVTTDSGYYVLVGPGTMFEGTNGIKIPDVTDGTSNTILVVETKRSIPWTKPEDISFDPDKPLPELGGFMKGEFAAAIADGSARVYDAAKAQDQLKWLIMRNDGHPIDIGKLGPDPRRVAEGAIGGRQRAQRDPIRRDFNNLKQLALAMHNYHDKHAHFPPAVVMGPDGKTTHSWRVELLSYLDAKALFDRYQMNEPWDSENNKKVLEQMPDVFRSPHDDPKSTNSGYYVLVGRGTIFEGPEGIKISDIMDGTSNTLMIVEAKRSIPWTKPEDIPYDRDKPVPELGGFVKGEFAAALADGSAHRFQTEDIAPGLLRRLIMRNDGNPISWDQLQGGR
jgi:beta-lactamase regulating signal transducer with metallopeptidase domain